MVPFVCFTGRPGAHVGGATAHPDLDWGPVFRRAPQYVVEEEHRDWSSAAGCTAMLRTRNYIEDSVHPLHAAGLLRFISPDAMLSKHVRAVPAAGHTPGNLCVRVEGSAATVTLAGDAMHHGVQILDPGLSTQYCVQPLEAARVRKTLLGQAAEDGSILLPTHFPMPSAGRVKQSSPGLSFQCATDLAMPGQFMVNKWRTAMKEQSA